jgi:hydrogenase nickel incorporation protein HypA/HybF
MHEWALAEAIFSAVLKIVKEKGLEKVAEIHIKIGELQQIDRQIFDFALEQHRSSAFRDTKLRIETEKAEFKCKVCERQWVFEEEDIKEEDVAEAIHFVPEMAHTFIRCPKCHSPDFRIITGRGVWLTSVKGMK